MDNDERPKKSKTTRYIVIGSVALIIILVLLAWVWLKSLFRKNREHNKREVVMDVPTNPMLLSYQDPFTVYWKKGIDAKPVHMPVFRYSYSNEATKLHTVGLQLERLQPGDLILTRHLRAHEKDSELEYMKHLFRDHEHVKRWSEPGFWRMMKQSCDIEAVIQNYTGEGLPTHVVVVGKVTPSYDSSSGEAIYSPENVELWDMKLRMGHHKLSLKQFMTQSPPTMFQYWVIHLNTKVPEDVRQNVAASLVDGEPNMSLKHIVKVYYARDAGICLHSRSEFYRAMIACGARSSTGHMEKLHLRNESDVIVLRCYESCQDDVRQNHLVDSFGEYTMSQWAQWSGLKDPYHSCSSFAYAILERMGLVLTMTESGMEYKDGDGTARTVRRKIVGQVLTYNEENDVLSEQDLKRRRDLWCSKALFDSTNRLRMRAPQHIAPCDFLRGDFQWHPGVCVSYASRFWFVME